MKPRIFDRILLVLLMLVLIALGLGFIAVALGFINAETVAYIAGRPFASSANAWITAGIGVLLMIIAIRLIIGINRRAPKTKSPAMILVGKSELGSSSITLAAVDEMVQRHCAANPAVKQCSSVLSVSKENRLLIALRTILEAEANVPEVTEALRNSLTEYIQSLTGVTVGDISIMVSTAPEKAEADKPVK